MINCNVLEIDMQESYQITIPGPIQAWQRAGRSKNGGHFTQAATRAAERSIGWHAVQQVGQHCLQGALAVRLEVAVAVPASCPPKRRAEALAGVVRPAVKPDCDNLSKTVLDALTGVLWRDDAQVVDLHVTKHYAAEAGAVITVRQL